MRPPGRRKRSPEELIEAKRKAEGRVTVRLWLKPEDRDALKAKLTGLGYAWPQVLETYVLNLLDQKHDK